jgi:hypothetical protein
MKTRRLGIAWSVAWGVAALLLVVLWVRSYFWADMFDWAYGPQSGLHLSSYIGRLVVAEIPRDASTFWWYQRVDNWIDERKNFEIYMTVGSVDRTDDVKSPVIAGFYVGTKGAIPAGEPRFLMFPHWIVVIVSGAVAIMPWLRWRFSLRTLLIATTVVAVVLGLIVYVSR